MQRAPTHQVKPQVCMPPQPLPKFLLNLPLTPTPVRMLRGSCIGRAGD